jgi:hypothetical protein
LAEPAPVAVEVGPVVALPAVATDAGEEVPLPDGADLAASEIALADHELFVAVHARRPDPKTGAGVAAFDLGARLWRWHEPSGCAVNARVVGLAVTATTVVCATRENDPGRGALTGLERASGRRLWQVSLRTIDGVAAAGHGDVVVATVGADAVVIDAGTGATRFVVPADNGLAPRFVLVDGVQGSRVIAIEHGGRLVARDAAMGGRALFALAIRGYVVGLASVPGRILVALAGGELVGVDPDTGAVAPIADWSPSWSVPARGDLFFDFPVADSFVVRSRGADGAVRFQVALPAAAEYELPVTRGPEPSAPLLLIDRRGASRVLGLDSQRGQVEAVHALPARGERGLVFSVAVAGAPLAGAVLSRPLAVWLWPVGGR